MNRKYQTMQLQEKSRVLARRGLVLMGGVLLLVACWGLFSADQPTGSSYPGANGLTQQMLWNPSPK